MSVQEIMTKGLIVIPASTSVVEAAKLMAERNVGAVVAGHGQKMEGIFTERDLLVKVIAAGKPVTAPIKDYMTVKISSIPPETDPAEALAMMQKKHLRHLPVVAEDGRLLGMLGIRDVADFIVATLNAELEALKG